MSKDDGVNIHPLVAGRETPFSLVCHVCHGRGFYRPPGRSDAIPCDCSAGAAIAAVEEARSRLAKVYDARTIELWLQSRNRALGGQRPLTLLRDGHSEEVLAAIERLPPP